MESTAVTNGRRSAAVSAPQKRVREMPSEKKARRRMLLHPFDQVIPDSERIGHNRERRIYGGAGREEAAVHYVEIVELVGLAVNVERGSPRIAAEPNRPVLMRHAGQRNAIANEQVASEQPPMTLRPVNLACGLPLHQLFQFRVQALMA